MKTNILMKKHLMKSLLFALIVWMGSHLYVSAQSSSKKTEKGPYIAFQDSTYHFGEVVEGDKITRVFSFSNTGTEPLLILDVKTTCGCTAPNWPKDPVMPGEQSEIKVVFNTAGKKGSQYKKVTVLSNATNQSSHPLVLTGEVKKKKTP